MAEYIERKDVIDTIENFLDMDKYYHPYSRGKIIPIPEIVSRVNGIPAADVVSKAAYDQVAWERHLAEIQLKSIGKSIGEKMDDVVPVVHGKWIYGKDIPEQERKKHPYKYLPECFYCSECYTEAYWDTDYGQQLFNYCPDCGAEMFKELQI